MSDESSSAQEPLQNLLAQLSGSEYKVLSYLHKLAEKFAYRGVWMADKTLEKATGVSLRQLGDVRKSLVKKGLVETETARGRGTCYCFPAPLARSSPNPGVEESIMVRRDAGEMEAKASPVPPAAMTPIASERTAPVAAVPVPRPPAPQAMPNEEATAPVSPGVEEPIMVRHDAGEMEAKASPVLPAAITPKASERQALVAAVLVPRPPAPQATPNEEATALVAKMMEGHKPNVLYLQKLQKLAVGSDNLLKCLRWMVDIDDPQLGIKRYRFQAEFGRGLFSTCIEHLLQSPDSPFLKSQRAQNS